MVLILMLKSFGGRNTQILDSDYGKVKYRNRVKSKSRVSIFTREPESLYVSLYCQIRSCESEPSISLFWNCFRYHEWMKSPELQQLTASEPLTLEQEYDMQKSWREDDDSKETSAHKITLCSGFINLLKSLFQS